MYNVCTHVCMRLCVWLFVCTSHLFTCIYRRCIPHFGLEEVSSLALSARISPYFDLYLHQPDQAHCLIQQTHWWSFLSFHFKTLFSHSKYILPDVEAISNLSNLEYLDISHNKITSLTPLSSLKSLRNLRCNHNSVAGMEVVSKLLSLEELWLNNNQIGNT